MLVCVSNILAVLCRGGGAEMDLGRPKRGGAILKNPPGAREHTVLSLALPEPTRQVCRFCLSLLPMLPPQTALRVALARTLLVARELASG